MPLTHEIMSAVEIRDYVAKELTPADASMPEKKKSAADRGMRNAEGGRNLSPCREGVNKDERYLRDLQNKSTAAAQKQQQAVVVESSELLNHSQYIPAKAIKIPTTRQMSFPVILYFPLIFSIIQNYENRAIYPKCIYRSMSDVLIFFAENEYENSGDDKREISNVSAGRRLISLRAFSAALDIAGASSALRSLAREVYAKVWWKSSRGKDTKPGNKNVKESLY